MVRQSQVGGNYGDARLWASGDVRLWDIDTLTGIVIIETTISYVTGVSFSPDGQTIAYKYWWDPEIVRFWDVNTQTSTYVSTVEPEHTWGDVLWVVAAEIKKHGRNISGLHIFNTILEDHTAAVRSVSFSPDGKTIASGGQGWGWGVTTSFCGMLLRRQK